MKFVLQLILFITAFVSNLYSHSDVHLDKHEHHKNEIGVAISPAYFIKDQIFAFGLHTHYVRNISKSKFGFGLGYERIFNEHNHNTFGLVGTYTPIEKLRFSVSPGFTIEDKNSIANFALHLESSYEYEINNLHIGPVFKLAYDPEDYHISLGIHIGFGF